jgi:hypothetical protein
LRRQRRAKGVEHRADRDHVVAHPDAARHLGGVVQAHLRRVRRRHHHRAHALGPERIAGDGERQRRVDAAGEPEQRAGKAVLVQVVARAQAQRAVDFGLQRQFGGDGAGDRVRAVELEQLQRLLEERRLAHQLAAPVEHAGGAVEHQFVLPADQVHVHHRQAGVADPLAEHLLPAGLLALVIRRGVDRQDGLRARRLGHRRGVRGPHVLADGQPEAHPFQLEDARLLASSEVALLVEHLVIGQIVLARHRGDAPVADQRCGVVAPAVGAELGEADHQAGALHLGREALERAAAIGEEALAQQQVLGRIAAQRQLGRQHQVGARGARARAELKDARRVAGEVADGAVDLSRGDQDAVGHREDSIMAACRRPNGCASPIRSPASPPRSGTALPAAIPSCGTSSSAR